MVGWKNYSISLLFMFHNLLKIGVSVREGGLSIWGALYLEGMSVQGGLLGGRPLLTVNRMTDASKNITLPKLRLRVVEKQILNFKRVKAQA